jgi:hypothetical protein
MADLQRPSTSACSAKQEPYSSFARPKVSFTQWMVARLRSRNDLYPSNPAASLSRTMVGHSAWMPRGRRTSAGLLPFLRHHSDHAICPKRWLSSRSFAGRPGRAAISRQLSFATTSLFVLNLFNIFNVSRIRSNRFSRMLNETFPSGAGVLCHLML